MPIREINGRRYDFQELSLEDSLEIEEMIPMFLATASGKALPRGTIIQIARKIFAWCLVDGKEMGDPVAFFSDKSMRPEFHKALMEGLKLNFEDLFTQLLGSFAGKAKVSGLMAKLSELMTLVRATPEEPH